MKKSLRFVDHYQMVVSFWFTVCGAALFCLGSHLRAEVGGPVALIGTMLIIVNGFHAYAKPGWEETRDAIADFLDDPLPCLINPSNMPLEAVIENGILQIDLNGLITPGEGEKK